jgi:hypothetical protein
MKASNFLFQIPGSDDIFDLDQIEQMPNKPKYVTVLDHTHCGFKSLGRMNASIALIKFG